MRDEITKLARGYKDKKSLVRRDGSETLHGTDWKRRKEELAARCGGRCERILSDGVRCRNDADDPHHIKPRSKGRDDRLENLIALCRACHNLVDWKRVKLRDLRREQNQPKKCHKHPKVVWHDERACPVCRLEAENDFLALTKDMR